MILSFKIENFRSIKKEIKIDFRASKKLNEDHLFNNTFVNKNEELLNSIILYGRNASGKSNILIAFSALSFLIENSDSFKHDSNIPPYEPFKFDKKCRNKPVKFEIEFLGIDTQTKYLYLLHYDAKNIVKESLLFYPNGVKAVLYNRENSKVTYGDYYKGARKTIERGLLDNQLFLSKASTNKVEYLNEVYKLLTKYLYVSTVHDTEYDKTIIRVFSEMMLKDEKLKANVLKLLQAGDTNIINFDISQNDTSTFKFPDSIPNEVKQNFVDKYKYEVKTNHLLFDDEKLIGKEDLTIDDESFGTKKLLTIGSLIIDTLNEGGVLVIDELDKGLHPLLTKMLIKLFHSKENNPKNAQLIFATHDSTLLDNDLFRRDQICFVDKEYEGGSVFYKLSDIKGVRKDIPIDKWYLSGRFKATPVISEISLDF